MKEKSDFQEGKLNAVDILMYTEKGSNMGTEVKS